MLLYVERPVLCSATGSALRSHSLRNVPNELQFFFIRRRRPFAGKVLLHEFFVSHTQHSKQKKAASKSAQNNLSHSRATHSLSTLIEERKYRPGKYLRNVKDFYQ